MSKMTPDINPKLNGNRVAGGGDGAFAAAAPLRAIPRAFVLGVDSKLLVSETFFPFLTL